MIKRTAMAGLAMAAVAAVGSPVSAQVVSGAEGTQVIGGQVYQQVLASQMGGMKVEATWSNGSSLFGFWGDLGGGLWGVQLDNRLRVSMTGSGDTFNTLWNVVLLDWAQGDDPDLSTLSFIGGPQYGGVLFDRTTRARDEVGAGGCAPIGPNCPGQTQGSAAGRDLDFENVPTGYTALFNSTPVTYSNAYSLLGLPPQYDLFQMVTINFGQCGFQCGGTDGPDVGNGSPFSFYMDTDVVPEPSSYALMATGLLGLIGVARRRRSA